jgi:regulator of sirC expression with transglutaminase-like and TPR domain
MSAGLRSRVDLTLFAHVVDRPDDAIDLAEATLLVAAPEYPDLDLDRHRGALERLGRLARLRRGEERLPDGGISRVLRFLYEELGFRGNAEHYYDPKNSFLNEVLERRLGIPISLAVVVLEVCRHAGVEAAGVSFPGHFLVRAPGTHGPTLVDPFTGRVLAAADLRQIYKRATGQDRDPDPKLLEPADKRTIITRMLANLRGIYAQQGDDAHLRGVLERLDVLAPARELEAELARLGGARPFRGGSSEAN